MSHLTLSCLYLCSLPFICDLIVIALSSLPLLLLTCLILCYASILILTSNCSTDLSYFAVPLLITPDITSGALYLGLEQVRLGKASLKKQGHKIDR